MLQILGLVLSCLLALTAGAQTALVPQATQGRISLEEWQPSETPAVPLVGEWRLYHGRFITAKDIPRLDKLRFHMINVPDQNWAALKLRSHHYGSYVLEVNGLTVKGLGIFFDQFFNTHRSTLYYYVGEELREVPLTEVGKLGKKRSTSIAQFVKASSRLPDDFNQGWLVIQVSSFAIEGGMLSVPILTDYMTKQTFETRFVRWEGFFILGAFFLLLVSNLCIYLQRRDDIGSLYITIFAAALALRYFSTEGLWGEFFTTPSSLLWLLGVGFVVFGLPIATMFMIMFLNYEFPRFVGKKTVLASQIYNVALVVMVIVSYPRISPNLIALAYLVFLTILPVLFFQMVHAARKGARGATLSAVGLLILMLCMTNDVLVGTSGFRAIYVGHYGMLAYVFTQSLVVGENFAFAFRTAERLSKDLKIEVERQTRDAKVILNSVQQGLMTINADGTINDDYSAFVKTILGEEHPERKHIRDVFLSRTDLTREKRDMTITILETSVGEDELGFETNAGNLPRNVIFDDNKILELDWQPVVNEKTDLCEKILLTIKDVTALKSLEKKNQKTQREMAIITRLLEISSDRFMVFYRSSRDLLEESRRMAGQTMGKNPETLRHLFVNMHTIKGAARTYHFNDITTVAHECEQYYAEVQRGEQAWNRETAMSLIVDVESALDEYFSINRYKLKRETEENVAKIDLKTVRDHILEFQTIKGYDLHPELMPIVTKMKNTFKNLYYSDARVLFEEMTNKLPMLAHDLGKEAPRIKIVGPHLGFNVDGCEVLRRIFVHLFRNALDHGIESPESRQKAGKDPAGTIVIELHPAANHELDILLHDDGAGLKLDRIYDKAKVQGLVPPGYEPEVAEIAEMIFLPGFSTATSVSEVSGRGVGMDAVRKMLADVGGRIGIELLEHPDRPRPTPFRFVIHFPADLWDMLGEGADKGSGAA
jgi:signal transduction histidine kinase